MSHVAKVVSAAFLAAILGCINIPDTFEARIYIDIRHIEEQADQFLDYVEGRTETLPSFEAPADDQSSRLSFLSQQFAALFESNKAYAQTLNDDSPLVKQIADAMKARHPQLEALKATGAVGENNRGFVEVVDPGAFASPEAENEGQRLVAAENEDRRALYKEVARLNSADGVTVSTVEAVYALKRLERATSGQKVQLPPPGPNFDAFKASAQGQRLGSAAQPNAWVVIP